MGKGRGMAGGGVEGVGGVAAEATQPGKGIWMGHFIQSKSSLHVVAQFMFVQHVRLLCQTHTRTHTDKCIPTHTHICVCIAVRAKRAARLTATFCSLPFYFLPFLTLAHNMQAYRHKGAERWGVWGEGSRLHHAGLLYKCFIMGLAFQTFIRFDLVCMLRESLPSGFRFSFILLPPLFFCIFMHAMSVSNGAIVS